MTLTLYNTLTRRKEPFRPIDPSNVRMYVCGPTVYDYAHIGNARPVIVFDVLFRLLRHIYGAEHVTYARNITDVDDKINARAAERTRAAADRGDPQADRDHAKQFHEDIAALGVLPPTVEPRATEHIAGDAGADRGAGRQRACLCGRGATCCSTCRRCRTTAGSSNRSLEEMEAGARVEVAPYKKRSDGLRAVEAVEARRAVVAFARRHRDAGPARLAHRVLGDGGEAPGPGVRHPRRRHRPGLSRTTRTRSRRSRCAHGTPVMANYWMHNGFLQVEGEKMSKSLGNFMTIHELLRRALAAARRCVWRMLSHPLSPADRLDGEALAEARRTLDHWYELTADAADRRAAAAPTCLEALARRSQHAAGDRRAACAALAKRRKRQTRGRRQRA